MCKEFKNNNKLLSLNELRHMEGEKVFVNGLEDCFGIVRKDRVDTKNFYYKFSNYDGIDKFYRIKNKEENK